MTKRRAMGPIDPMLSRRGVLRGGAHAFGLLGLSLLGGSVVVPTARAAGADDFGPLQSSDANGLRLPPGFSSRIVARSGAPVAATSHTWHEAPDGGATFATADGGWVYVSNAELYKQGGVGAIRFAPDGTIVDAYPILSGTDRNCAGGPTPWGTWLSCEEIDEGRVYECNPQAPSQGVLVPSLGTFRHEAAAVDPVHGTVYLTEDQRNGRLYRFRCASYPSLAAGTLEVAEVLDPEGRGPIGPGQVRRLRWHPLAEPNPAGGGASTRRRPAERATRYQVPASTAFDGGEGCSYRAGQVFFATKGDGRVWKLDTAADTLSIYYDQATNANALAT
ncbi:MAG: alkaline phosphatase PhoX, partial [Myxococcota bacterium]